MVDKTETLWTEQVRTTYGLRTDETRRCAVEAHPEECGGWEKWRNRLDSESETTNKNTGNCTLARLQFLLWASFDSSVQWCQCILKTITSLQIQSIRPKIQKVEGQNCHWTFDRNIKNTKILVRTRIYLCNFFRNIIPLIKDLTTICVGLIFGPTGYNLDLLGQFLDCVVWC